jgi:hypothetical protein
MIVEYINKKHIPRLEYILQITAGEMSATLKELPKLSSTLLSQYITQSEMAMIDIDILGHPYKMKEKGYTVQSPATKEKSDITLCRSICLTAIIRASFEVKNPTFLYRTAMD